MKVTHVLPMLIKGGGERVAVDLANESMRAGHEVAIVAACPVDEALLQNAVLPGIRIRFVSDSMSPKLVRYAQMTLWTWRQRGWLFEQDVLHCHLTYGAVFGTLVQLWRWAMRKPGPVVVETYHAVGMAIPALHRRLHALLASRRDALALMAEDSYWRAFCAAHPRLLTRIIPNGISVAAPDAGRRAARGAYREALGIPADCPLVVGTVGMLRPDRKPWLYVPIFARIARDFGPSVHFIVAGGGPALGRMQALVAEHGFADRIHLIGLVIEPQAVFDIIDLYVTLNVGPNTGLAALEAALSGLPVIAVQMSPDYVAGADDWIWSDPEPSNVATRAVDLLRSSTERNALANRQAAYARAHHGVQAMARAYEELYQAATERLRNRANQ